MPGSSSSKTSAATTCAHESRADARGNALSARRRRLFCTHAMPYGQSSSAPASDRTHQVMADTQHTHTGDCCGPAAPCWSSGSPSTTCAAPATPFRVSAFYLLESKPQGASHMLPATSAACTALARAGGNVPFVFALTAGIAVLPRHTTSVEAVKWRQPRHTTSPTVPQ